MGVADQWERAAGSPCVVIAIAIEPQEEELTLRLFGRLVNSLTRTSLVLLITPRCNPQVAAYQGEPQVASAPQ